ncbi:MAG: ankyrin repeat domain-containing protein [Parachlamydiaceae bacterium]|nr:ankyrin repeat domain-containing protein [Parachlamydiaceae bacterium]
MTINTNRLPFDPINQPYLSFNSSYSNSYKNINILSAPSISKNFFNDPQEPLPLSKDLSKHKITVIDIVPDTDLAEKDSWEKNKSSFLIENLDSSLYNVELLKQSEAGNRLHILALLKLRADINTVDAAGETPLHIAVKNDYHFLLRSLLRCNANESATNFYNATPLTQAIALNHQESIRRLFKHGYFRIRHPRSILKGGKDIKVKSANDVKNLLELFCNIKKFLTNEINKAILNSTHSTTRNSDIISLLLECGADKSAILEILQENIHKILSVENTSARDYTEICTLKELRLRVLASIVDTIRTHPFILYILSPLNFSYIENIFQNEPDSKDLCKKLQKVVIIYESQLTETSELLQE